MVDATRTEAPLCRHTNGRSALMKKQQRPKRAVRYTRRDLLPLQLLDQTVFELDDTRFHQFISLLEARPHRNAAVESLANERSHVVETEAGMKKRVAAVSHHEREVAELRSDRELAVEYLKAAMESLDDPEDRAAGLVALRTVAEAYGGLAAVATEAGVSRESLYRALSPKGNPTLKTLIAVLKTVGMRLSVEPEDHAHA